MKAYTSFIKAIDTNLIYSLIPIILSLALLKLLFKNRFDIPKALNLIRWMIISYTILILISFLISFIFYSNESLFLSRSTGPYYLTYWIMMFSSSILPLTLLYRKLGTSILYLILVSFMMKIGVYFEQFVIITTSFNRDNMVNSYNHELKPLVLNGFLVFSLQGLFIALLIITVIEILKGYKLSRSY